MERTLISSSIANMQEEDHFCTSPQVMALTGGRDGGDRFDYAHCGRKLCGGEEKNCENGAHHRGVLIIINRRTYCFGCPSRRRSVSRAVVGLPRSAGGAACECVCVTKSIGTLL
ncbi:hypothetical protein QTP88_010170 [Uroleucon formosanum]